MNEQKITRNELIFFGKASPVCDCGHDGEGFEFQESGEVEIQGRKVKKIWFDGKAPSGITVPQWQNAVMAGLKEISGFTNTDFVQTTVKGQSWLEIYVATDEEMWAFWNTKPVIYRAIQKGKWIRFTNRANQFSPLSARRIERITIHETGHRLGMGHSSDLTSIMHVNVGATVPNAKDKAEFARRLK